MKNRILLLLLVVVLARGAAVHGQVSTPAVDPVNFSVAGGVFASNVSVALVSRTPGAIIRYTVNNTEPAAGSAIYVKPILVSTATIIRARAFAPGLSPGPAAAEAYTLLDSDLVDFSSNLPLMIINSHGRPIYPDMAERVVATVTVWASTCCWNESRWARTA